MHTQILILGSGPAGLTAGLYSALAGFQTTLLTGPTQGGQLVLTNDLENFPGFSSDSGFSFIDKLSTQTKNAGTQIIYDSAIQVDVSQYPFLIHTQNRELWQTDSLIIATGASAKWLGIQGEKNLIGHGISICATCDGFFFKDKTVAVIGGGSSAVYEALFLSQTCATVYLIYQTLVAEHNLLTQLRQNTKIICLPHTTVTSFHGTKKLSALTYSDRRGREHILPVDGVFEAIGHLPNSSLFLHKLDIDPHGYIQTNPTSMETSVKGVFACGDVQNTSFRQAVIAAGSGCTAALFAKKFLLEKHITPY